MVEPNRITINFGKPRVDMSTNQQLPQPLLVSKDARRVEQHPWAAAVNMEADQAVHQKAASSLNVSQMQGGAAGEKKQSWWGKRPAGSRQKSSPHTHSIPTDSVNPAPDFVILAIQAGAAEGQESILPVSDAAITNPVGHPTASAVLCHNHEGRAAVNAGIMAVVEKSMNTPGSHEADSFQKPAVAGSGCVQISAACHGGVATADIMPASALAARVSAEVPQGDADDVSRSDISTRALSSYNNSSAMAAAGKAVEHPGGLPTTKAPSGLPEADARVSTEGVGDMPSSQRSLHQSDAQEAAAALQV
jgi:hypothetical protein